MSLYQKDGVNVIDDIGICARLTENYIKMHLRL